MFWRGIALFVGVLTLVDVLAGKAATPAGATIWWIDVRALPSAAGVALLLTSAVAMGVFALGVRTPRVRRASAVVLVGLATVAAGNVVAFYLVWRQGRVTPAVPVPLSVGISMILGWMAWRCWQPASVSKVRWRGRTAFVGGAVTAAIALPLGQVGFFGYSNYEQPADAAVVFGARAHANGAPSLALFDRVRTACDLYQRGQVRTLIFSGGPGDGAIHETEAMRRIALSRGVPDEAIILDRDGLNTAATARNITALLPPIAAGQKPRVLLVTHGYHQARAKLAFAAEGLAVRTVPASETRKLAALPFYIAREIPALWVYYVRSAVGASD